MCRCAYHVYILNDNKDVLQHFRVVGKWQVRVWQEYAASNGLWCEWVKE